ncbi:MAG: ABC transporter permease [Muribaculaceae bacterium]|nr:ABC transporter permease [Muribaculaceae bacterium]
MKFEFFIASKLKLGSGEKGSPSLNVALVGIILAIVIMLLSVFIVLGFKNEITTKVNSLDSHLKVLNGAIGIDDNYSVVDFREVDKALKQDTPLMQRTISYSLIAEKPAILKTDEDFKGLQFRGVDERFDFTFLKSHLLKGRVPNFENPDSTQEIIISQTIANQLHLDVNNKIFTYFIDNKVKVRNCKIVGIFNTDFDTFDKAYIVGNIALLQSVNEWKSYMGNYVGVNLDDVDNIEQDSYELYGVLAEQSYGDDDTSTVYTVTNTRQNNISYYTWLGMLDMNVVIILVLMVIVSSFTLISALLMIVLERIKMIGLFKAMGTGNSSIRKIFIYLTQKLIFKSILIGNAVGIGLALIQKYFHVIKLDPDAYYMNYVPISINVPALVILNIAIIVISYITLIGPSYIISSIKPTSTMRFE